VPTSFTCRHTGVILRPAKTPDGRVEPAFYESAVIRGFEGSRGCVLGRYFISPQANGDVYPCPFLPISVGNLRNQSISEIWKGAELFQRVRRRDFTGLCGTCNDKDECGGCRARAYALTGNLYASDPLCHQVMTSLAEDEVNSDEELDGRAPADTQFLKRCG
jgi:radical SAM protein with 4Fe4S-binding SPASM domain